MNSKLVEKDKRVVSLAIQIAEHSAAITTSSRSAVSAAASARAVASTAILPAASYAARAAGFAALAASPDAGSAAAAAASAAAAAAAAAADAAYAIIKDFAVLQDKVGSEQWSKITPIPISVLGELWPEGAPDWFCGEASRPGVAAAGGENTISFDLWIDPGNASKTTLQEVLVALSELHLAAGGSGLKFITDGAFVRVREFEPA